MKFKVYHTWNGFIVTDAHCTAAQARDLSYNFFANNFSDDIGGMVCSVDHLIEMEVGDCFRTSYFDMTGRGKIVIVKLEV